MRFIIFHSDQHSKIENRYCCHSLFQFLPLIFKVSFLFSFLLFLFQGFSFFFSFEILFPLRFTPFTISSFHFFHTFSQNSYSPCSFIPWEGRKVDLAWCIFWFVWRMDGWAAWPPMAVHLDPRATPPIQTREKKARNGGGWKRIFAAPNSRQFHRLRLTKWGERYNVDCLSSYSAQTTGKWYVSHRQDKSKRDWRKLNKMFKF